MPVKSNSFQLGRNTFQIFMTFLYDIPDQKYGVYYAFSWYYYCFWFNSRSGMNLFLKSSCILKFQCFNDNRLTAVRCGWRIPLVLIELPSAKVTLICFTKEEQFTIPLTEKVILRSPVVAISSLLLRRRSINKILLHFRWSPVASCLFYYFWPPG